MMIGSIDANLKDRQQVRPDVIGRCQLMKPTTDCLSVRPSVWVEL